jgi:glycolate oxidase
MRMNRIWEVDTEGRTAWVGPGVINLDLTRHTEPMGFHFAPDPSSQSICTVGGNVANNSGGPLCLAEGTTVAHILGVEMVAADGEVMIVGGAAPDLPGLDLRSVIVGSEGTVGVVTKVLVKLTENPPDVRTLLLAFPDVVGAARTVSDTIAAGIVPAALEMMDRPMIAAVENFVHAGYPTDAGAVLLAEVAGHPAAVAAEADIIAGIAASAGAGEVRVAGRGPERDLLWLGRKSAFGAVAQAAPDYYLHDTVVPRTRLVEVMTRLYEIAETYDLLMLNVFHAGDGNLHPLMAFDAREPGMLERVKAAGEEIVRVSVAVGGALSGEHGIGLEKRDFMGEVYAAVDLDAQARLRDAFDPDALMNPGKILPAGSRRFDFDFPRPAVDAGVTG